MAFPILVNDDIGIDDGKVWGEVRPSFAAVAHAHAAVATLYLFLPRRVKSLM